MGGGPRLWPAQQEGDAYLAMMEVMEADCARYTRINDNKQVGGPSGGPTPPVVALWTHVAQWMQVSEANTWLPVQWCDRHG